MQTNLGEGKSLYRQKNTEDNKETYTGPIKVNKHHPIDKKLKFILEAKSSNNGLEERYKQKNKTVIKTGIPQMKNLVKAEFFSSEPSVLFEKRKHSIAFNPEVE